MTGARPAERVFRSCAHRPSYEPPRCRLCMANSFRLRYFTRSHAADSSDPHSIRDGSACLLPARWHSNDLSCVQTPARLLASAPMVPSMHGKQLPPPRLHAKPSRRSRDPCSFRDGSSSLIPVQETLPRRSGAILCLTSSRNSRVHTAALIRRTRQQTEPSR